MNKKVAKKEMESFKSTLWYRFFVETKGRRNFDVHWYADHRGISVAKAKQIFVAWTRYGFAEAAGEGKVVLV